MSKNIENSEPQEQLDLGMIEENNKCLELLRKQKFKGHLI